MLTWYDHYEDKKAKWKAQAERKAKHPYWCNVQKDAAGWCSCGIDDSPIEMPRKEKN